MMAFLIIVAAAMTTVTASANSRPNILLVMCDDLDSMLGSPEIALPQIKRLLVQKGATMQNYMVRFKIAVACLYIFFQLQYFSKPKTITTFTFAGIISKMYTIPFSMA